MFVYRQHFQLIALRSLELQDCNYESLYADITLYALFKLLLCVLSLMYVSQTQISAHQIQIQISADQKRWCLITPGFPIAVVKYANMELQVPTSLLSVCTTMLPVNIIYCIANSNSNFLRTKFKFKFLQTKRWCLITPGFPITASL